MTPKNNFKFYINADISKAKNGKDMIIQGIASTSAKDSQGEFLDPRTFDLNDFNWINWNHKGKDDPSTIIGEPIHAEVNEKNELFIKGLLYDDVPMAKATYKLMKALQKSPTGNRLGMSVEGRVIERDSMNPAKILKSKITGVAICPVPVNGATWTELITKGYTENETPIYDIDQYADKEVEKAMSIEGTTGALENEGIDRKLEHESVEGTKKKKKKKNGETVDLKVLTKSEAYKSIFNYFYINDIAKAKQIYSLIENISIMDKQQITKETIEKALEIIKVADSVVSSNEDATSDVVETSEEIETTAEATEEVEKSETENIEKGEKTNDAPDNVEEKEAVAEKDEDSEEEDEDVEKSIYKSACNYAKKLFSKGMDEDEIKKAMSKVYSKDVTTKACASVDMGANAAANMGGITPQGSIKKSETIELEKSFSAMADKFENLSKSFEEKFDTIKKSYDNLSEENSTLKNRIKEIENTPTAPKSLISKSWAERFESKIKEGGDIEKGEIYSLSNKQSREDLINKAFEMAIEKGDDDLSRIVKGLEATKQIDDRGQAKLKALGINVLP